MSIYSDILKQPRQKRFAVLIDPDKYQEESLRSIVALAGEHADLILVGGSLLTADHLQSTITRIKEGTNLPVILFPGSLLQIDARADAILLLSMISGRNADLLIGKHVIAAPYLKQSGLEILPTGYMLVDGGTVTTVHYISNTIPIPRQKADIAASTAIAGEMLGLRLIYLDAGSGAGHPVPPEMIRRVKDNLSIPLIVGGGIRTPEQAGQACKAGADVIVIGNAIEKDPSLIRAFSRAVHDQN